MNKKIGIGILVVLATGSFAAKPAEAGTYPVVACMADANRFRTHAFSDFANRGMKIRRACGSSVSRAKRGLLAGNVVRKGSVARNSRAELTLAAPAGMSFSKLEWRGRVRRADCNYGIEIAAIGGPRPLALRKIAARERCPRKGKAQTSRELGNGARNIAGTNRIVLRVICRARVGRRCSNRKSNFASFTAVDAKVVDVTPPSVSITGGDLVSGRWVRGTSRSLHRD